MKNKIKIVHSKTCNYKPRLNSINKNTFLKINE